MLGSCYEYGKGVPIDIQKTVFWYKKAAEQGDGDVMIAVVFRTNVKISNPNADSLGQCSKAFAFVQPARQYPCTIKLHTVKKPKKFSDLYLHINDFGIIDSHLDVHDDQFFIKGIR